MAQILIIDDEPLIQISLSENIKRIGYTPIEAYSIRDGIEILNKKEIDLVFLDVKLPDGNGLKRITQIKNTPSSPQVIIITGEGNEKGATEAIKNGAWDYIEKPFEPDRIMLLMDRTLKYRFSKNKLLKNVQLKTESIIGKSDSIKKSLNQAAVSSQNSANLLILGETGTGKELFAREIHKNSRFSNGEFTIVDCAALPYSLAESILFGHEKGAFTGADKPAEGLIKKADNGTLFLDEVGELPAALQKKFLRVLQEKKFKPVGSTKEISSNFRLISATNRDLESMSLQNKFRKDLLHRLKTTTIELPPLKKRKKDIDPLVNYFIEKLCTKHFLKPKVMLPETLEILTNHEWPGNIRELMNVVEESILAEPELPIIYPIFLPDGIRVKYFSGKKKYEKKSITREKEDFARFFSQLSSKEAMPKLKDFRENVVEKAEKIYLKALLDQTDWNLDNSAKVSGISKSRLYSLTKKYRFRKKNLNQGL